jgi:hypothetical protein
MSVITVATAAVEYLHGDADGLALGGWALCVAPLETPEKRQW